MEVVQSSLHEAEGSIAVLATDNDLGNHWIVIDGNTVTLTHARVDANSAHWTNHFSVWRKRVVVQSASARQEVAVREERE